MYCHGTEIRSNYIRLSTLGLSGVSKAQELNCVNGAFVTPEGATVSLYRASCYRIMEPEVIREEKSDCSSGLGADGRTENLDEITLVKVGWKINDHFEEQVFDT